MQIFWNILDEWRFVVSILLAQFVFFWFSSKKQKGFVWKVIVGIAVILATSLAIILWRPVLVRLVGMNTLSEALIIIWYMAMVVITVILCKLLFVNTWWESLFRANCAYVIQQIAYVLCYGVVFRFFPQIRRTEFLWPLRFVIPILMYGAIYVAAYFLLAKRFNKVKDSGSKSNKKVLFVSLVVFVSVVLFNLFMQGYIWTTPVERVYRGAFIVLMGCVMSAFTQLALFSIKNLDKENKLLKNFLQEKQRQYEISKENIEIINHKSHNLKHLIEAFKVASQTEKEKAIAEIEKAVMIYDSVVKTDNEAVNIILTEKALHCEKEKIRLSCIVDSKDLNFINTIDMYAILGNALDNAIECVEKYADPLKRTISLNIHSENGFLSIRMDNHFEGDLSLEEGLPLTTKKDKDFHGFGIKSIKLIVEKYNGIVHVETKDKTFSLQTIIPLP